MTAPNEGVVEHRLERARDTLAEARLLAEHNHVNACVNRLYYPCFYAVSALLESRGMSASKHTGVRSLFGRHFVSTGVIAKDLAAVYNELFEYRQGSDYEDFFHVDAALIPRWLEQVGQFVEVVAKAATKPAGAWVRGPAGPPRSRLLRYGGSAGGGRSRAKSDLAPRI